MLEVRRESNCFGDGEFYAAQSSCSVVREDSSIESRYNVPGGKEMNDGVEELIGESGEGSGRGSSASRLERKSE